MDELTAWLEEQLRKEEVKIETAMKAYNYTATAMGKAQAYRNTLKHIKEESK